MLNLLPERERDMVAKEYRLRRWAVVFVFLTLLGLISLVFLAPAYTVVYLEKQQLSKSLNDLKVDTDELINPEMFQRIADISDSLNLLAPHTEDIFIVDVLRDIVSHRSDMLSVTSFAIRKDGDSRSMAISLSGQAKNRDVLLNFSERLKSEEYIMETHIPLDSFTQEEDLDFSMQIKGDF